MSKKLVSKVIGSTIGGGALDMFGIRQQDQQEKAAKQAARVQEEQARQQAAQAAEAAAQAQRQIALDGERQNAQRAAEESQQVETSTPTLELSINTETPAQRRKRFQGTTIGGSAGDTGATGTGISLRV